jgi:hypothetical protein
MRAHQSGSAPARPSKSDDTDSSSTPACQRSLAMMLSISSRSEGGSSAVPALEDGVELEANDRASVLLDETEWKKGDDDCEKEDESLERRVRDE